MNFILKNEKKKNIKEDCFYRNCIKKFKKINIKKNEIKNFAKLYLFFSHFIVYACARSLYFGRELKQVKKVCELCMK